MKILSAIILIMLCTSLWARDGQILKCLGEEEKRLHLKKETGPIYDLNQRLISELIQIPRVQLKKNDYYVICKGGQFSESLKLLELSLKKGKDLFVIPANVRGMQKAMREGMIEDYVEASKEILLSFISQIQTLSPTPTCLKEEIPQLDKLFTEVKYLQEDVDMKTLFEGKDEKIFDKLKGYREAFEKCRARLKKKASSGSTASPKNN